MSSDQHLKPGNLVAFFHRHVVPMQFAFRKSDEVHHRIISAFVISVRDNWYLVTAGHCLDDIQKNVDAGWTVANVWLFDSMGVGATFVDPIPFAWSADSAGRVFKDSNDDFGLIIIDDLTRRNLEANKIVPLTEQVWDLQPEKPEAFMLIGVPSELARPSSPMSNVVSVALFIDEATQRPEYIEETAADRWYGHVRLPEQGLSDIAGMSGGPIFSIAAGPEGGTKYWLHAVQSAWHRPSRAIAACPTRYLGQLIDRAITGELFEESRL